jgi:hypothetical protein
LCLGIHAQGDLTQKTLWPLWQKKRLYGTVILFSKKHKKTQNPPNLFTKKQKFTKKYKKQHPQTPKKHN